MGLSVFWQFVGWLSLPVLAILAGVLLWRKAFRDFPYFFYYVVSAEAVGLVRLGVYYFVRRAYLYTYWILDVLITLFALLTTYELFLRRLFPAFHRTRFYRGLFPMVAVVLSFLAAPVALQTHHLHGLLVTLRVLDFFRLATLLFFVGLMLLMGRHWTRSEFAIGLGLAVQAAALVATFAIWSGNPQVHGIVDQIPTMAYDVACLVWLITFLRAPEKSTAVSTVVKPDVIQEAKAWEKTLRESVTRKKNS